MSTTKINPRLGVNIDHFATIRQARGTDYPSLSLAAEKSFVAGADQITIHLREDRRHIQDFDVFDVKAVCEKFQKPLNLEMSTSEDVIKVAYEARPEWVCLVPEKREEKTTEGGLNLLDQNTLNKINTVAENLKSKIPHLKISLFIEGNEPTLELVQEDLIDAVEIHTGAYAIDYLKGNAAQVEKHLEQFKTAYEYTLHKKYSFHAGHGLDDHMTRQLVGLNIFEEYNIGHWIVAQSLFDSLESVVKNLKAILDGEENL